ncbi:VOC family protein [Luedemannella helvata]|uniref:VOC domain-containing protein n=1 Tax=Luedemannella helvata TaxID=349315 RepID=A0ABP4X3R7_9ACTN
MLAYENGPAAMDWLSKAFGFVERTRMIDDDGVLGHGEMALGDGVVMLATPSPHYQSPKHHRQVCEAAGKWLSTPFVIDGVLLAVDDLDGHYAQATAAGATVLQEPTDRGDEAFAGIAEAAGERRAVQHQAWLDMVAHRLAGRHVAVPAPVADPTSISTLPAPTRSPSRDNHSSAAA